MGGASDDDPVHVGVVGIVCEKHDSQFNVDCPDPQNRFAMLEEPVGCYK